MTKRPLMIPVLEIFGPTFQGEGRAIGRPCLSERLFVIITVLGVTQFLLGMVQKSQNV